MTALLETWLGVRFLAPQWLLLLPLVPVLWLVRARQRPPAVPFAPFPLLERGADGSADSLPGSWRSRLGGLPTALFALGLMAALIAVARPLRREVLPPERPGLDLLLVMDRSSSMLERDLDPERTRLDVARDAATRFARERASDRIGLIGFARWPDLLCPLTRDHRALAAFLRDLSPADRESREDATGIGTALALAADVLRRSEARGRVVVLLTDGEENVATSRTPGEIAPLHAAQLLEQEGIRVHAITIGRGRRDPGGAWRPLDGRQLQAVAERSGGRFFNAPDAAALQAIYREIDALEKAPLPGIRHRNHPLHGPPLLAALACLLGAWMLRRGPLRVLP